jgi:WD40 repeat protein
MYHYDMVNGAQVFSNDQRVLTWSSDGTAHIWNATTGQAIGEIMNNKINILGAQLLANEHLVLTWSEDGAVRVWDTNTGKSLITPIYSDNSIKDVKIIPIESKIVILSDASVSIYIIPSYRHDLIYFNEIQQALKNRYYVNSANDPIFLTEDQVEKCQTLYQPYQECNESDSNLCKVKRQWWSVQKFFGQLPTLADCLK